MLGRKSVHAQTCNDGEFIGADFGININLKNKFPENWREFNKKYIPVFLENNPGKSKIAAGLACGAIHTICKHLKDGDIILSPDGRGSYMVGEVNGDYYYDEGEILPHRRPMTWYPKTVLRSSMSQELQYSTGSIGTVSDITKYADELESLIKDNRPSKIISTDNTIEDPSVFALEKHLEEFLVTNWKHTILGKNYNI